MYFIPVLLVSLTGRVCLWSKFFDRNDGLTVRKEKHLFQMKVCAAGKIYFDGRECIYKISTGKHNSCIFYYYVKVFSQKQRVSTQLRGHHQASIVMKIKMALHK
jgi:hypothetical protein